VAALASTSACSNQKKKHTTKKEASTHTTQKKASSQKEKTPFSLLDHLPEGSILRQVRLPRYDKNFTPLSLLTAEKLLVIGEDEINASGVKIELYTKDGTTRASAHMREAIFHPSKKILRAQHAVHLKGIHFEASGTGLTVDLNKAQGFLFGPASTLFLTNKKSQPSPSAMRSFHPSPFLTSTVATAVASTLLSVTPTLTALPPTPLTSAELTELDTASAPIEKTITEKQENTQASLSADATDNQKASATIAPFLKKIGQEALLISTTKPTAAPAKTPPPKQPSPKKSPSSPQNKLRVDCEGGVYFDNDSGVLAFLKNVKLTETSFTLTCSKELKVFLEEKPKHKKSDTQKSSSFGDLKRIIATGDVKVTRKDDKGNLFIATGETASYDAKTGKMILKGGYPRLQQSSNQYLQAASEGAWIVIHKDGKLITSHSKWTMQTTTKKTSR